jgi:hypothetical protein
MNVSRNVVHLALLALALAACGAAPGQTASPGPTPAATQPPTASPSPTATATAPAGPSLTPSPAASESPPPPTELATSGPCAGASADEQLLPPAVELAAADGGPVAGVLGTFTYCGLSADALPPRAASLMRLRLGNPPTARLTMTPGDGLSAYQAGYWPAAEWQGDEIRFAGDGFDAPLAALTFDGPPVGDWMVALHATYASGGHAIYYWHVSVP